MFYDTEIEVYDNPTYTIYNYSFYGDFQEYDKVLKIEEFVFNIDHRVFCDYTTLITDKSYFKINGEIYKCIKPKIFDNYMEIMLYKCQGGGN
ncbi:hypothetical protein [Clostridium scatologenes]|uniref:Phage head-tail adaptor n=1 Tax=Clostridium scatologenes TaxID=1548 RepID=A0A0E3M8P6_CLOSL|nr:hypothetical protein [Clostridium scatologenes]AKA71972.1 hypothetical protein CSCA_4847 [Clostridium scatologenes]